MPDTVERLIYKLEIDDAGYIRGIDSMSASTAKLVEQQNKANQTLQTNQAALKNSSEVLRKAKQDLDNYTGTNERYRQQLQNDFTNAQAEQKKLTDLVAGNQKAYEAATKAAQDFANISAKATNLQQQTTGGKIVPNVIAPPVNVPQVPTDLSGLEQSVAATTDEFQQLAQAIQFAETEMQSLDKESEEFKLLAPIVEQGKEVLQQYGNVVEQTGKRQISLRQQILNNNNELARLEETGRGTTQVYIQLEKETAHLSRLYAEQRERVRILASDTRAFDFGKAAVESAVSGFQLYTSISVLAGGASEKLEKETVQLFAAMQLLTGLEQLANQVKRGGVISTNLQSVAQATYTAVVGASTGALKAFRLALLGTGIGAAVVAIGFLIQKYNQYKEAVEKANQEQKDFKEINDKAIDSFATQVTRLNLIKQQLDNANTPLKDRIELAKSYNKQADEGNRIDLKQIDNINLLNSAIDRQIAKIKERAFATAAEQFVAEKAADLLKAQADLISKFPDLPVDEATINRLVEQSKKGVLDLTQFSKKQHQEFIAAVLSGDVKAFLNARSALDAALKTAQPFITPQGLTSFDKGSGGKSTIENVFEQERQSLITKLAELRRSEATDIQRINDEFAQKLIQEQIRIAKLVKDKKVTAEQGKVLLNLAVQVNQEGLNKALADAKKKIDEARQKLNDDLRNLQSKANLDSLNLLQDDFEKRKALLDFNEQKEIADQKANTEERLKDLEEERRLKLISEADYQRARAIIVATGEQEINSIIQKFGQDRQDLAADIFKKSLEAYQKAITAGDFIRDQDLNDEVTKQAARFFKGQISFETFQKNITKFQREQEAQRRAGEIQVLEDELSDLDRHLAAIKDTNSKEYRDTKNTRDKLANDITVKKTDDTKKNVEDKNAVTDDRTKQVIAYTDAVGQLADSVISFWTKANEAEQRALDRSIEIQQQRVDEAQKIAERGNAQYLKTETDRLKELQVARENAARRQLAIDAALQASQILVAVTGAISKIATPGIGAAEVIAEIAIIVGALATGYGLVKSLQGNQPKLRKGEPYVRRGNNPSGVDTIPAMLNEGERVVTTEENRDYNPVLNAIHNRTIKPEVLNEFVKHHHEIKPVPQPNYEKIKQVNEIKMTQDGKLAVIMQEHSKKLDENNQLQRQTQEILKRMKNEFHMDEKGFAASWMGYVDQVQKNKKL